MQRTLLRLLFAATMFLSAALLFWVQPLVARMLLPSFGGAPAVWTVSMLFFQSGLLLGYLITDQSTRRLSLKQQSVLLLVLLAIPLVVLPLRVPAATDWGGSDPTGLLLWTLARCVGLPFVVLSMLAPILQRMFVAADPSGRDQAYTLYAASNAGSLLSLLAFPVLIEPALGLRMQGIVWLAAYGVLIGLVGLCLQQARRGEESAPQTVDPGPPVTWSTRGWWLVLSALPSSVSLAATTYLSTEIWPLPMLWVVPLALYLLSFILAFAAWRSPRLTIPLGYLAVLTATLTVGSIPMGLSLSAPAMLTIHLTGVLILGTACHSRLADLRPAPGRLTEFYLFLAIGGLLGGIFNALIAPVAFNALYEYPITLLLTALVAALWISKRESYWPVWIAFGVGLGWTWFTFTGKSANVETIWRLTFVFLPALFMYLGRVPLGATACLVTSTIAMYQTQSVDREVLHVERSFFGVHRVVAGGEDEWKYHMLIHGMIQHGQQWLDPQKSRMPLMYYFPTGPVGAVFDQLAQAVKANRRVGLVGLGTGTLAAYGLPGDEYDFFEIDPSIARVAQDPTLFTMIAQSKARINVILGDARLKINEQPDATYDLLVLDAFSGDAIPCHLLTREALAIYRRKLRPAGILAVHVSNHYMSLTPVLSRLAADQQMICLEWEDSDLSEDDEGRGKAVSTWVVLTDSIPFAARLGKNPAWLPVFPQPDAPVWTDDYTNVISILTLE